MKVLRKVVVLASAAVFALCANRSANAGPVENFDWTGGEALWTVEADGSWRSGQGAGSFWSGAEVDIDTSLYAVGPAIVSFDWKVSSQAGIGFLGFYFDFDADYDYESEIMGIPDSISRSGESDWATVSFVVTDPAKLALYWEYWKEGDEIAGEDCGWVKNLQVNPFEGEIREITLDYNMEEMGTDSIRVADGIAIGYYLPDRYELDWVEGYSFVGWFTDPEEGELVTQSTVVTPGLETLYAHWRKVVPPANDDYDNAEAISGASGSVDGTLVDATIADNDCAWHYGYTERTVWYKWVAPFTGRAEFTATAENGRDDLLYLIATYGYDEEEGEWNDCGYDYGNIVRFEVKEGETYYISLGTWNDVVEGFTIAWQEYVPVKWTVEEDGTWRSGAISHADFSVKELHVVGPGRGTFEWKVSSEEDCDYLVFSIDGNDVSEISGDIDWATVNFSVEGYGDHVLTWTYYKDESETNGEDCGWVRNFTYDNTPHATVEVVSVGGESLELPTNVVLFVGEQIGEENLANLTEAVLDAVPSRHGARLAGFSDGSRAITAQTVVTDGMTILADWETFNPFTEDETSALDDSAAQTFDGYVLDAKGNAAGTIQVTVGKPNKSRLASIKATVQMLGQKKLKFQGNDQGKIALDQGGAVSNVVLVSKGASSEIVLEYVSSKGMFGSYGDYEIAAALNSAKKAAADYSKWVGKYSVAFEADSTAAFAGGYSTVTVDVAAKGKVNVSGTMSDGAKVNAKAQLILGDGGSNACVNVVVPMYSGSKGGFGFVLWLEADGSVVVESVSDWKCASKTPFTAKLALAAAGRVSAAAKYEFALVDGLPADVGGAAVLTKLGEASLLPDGTVLAMSGAKLTAPKAGKVKYDRKQSAVTVTGDNANNSALRVTYTASTGALKGSFSVYTLKGTALKKVSAALTGVMVDGVGYGTASIKNVGAFKFELRVKAE